MLKAWLRCAALQATGWRRRSFLLRHGFKRAMLQVTVSCRLAPPSLTGFKGGQNVRANVVCTALERPRAALVSPLRQAQRRLSSFAGEARPFGLSLRAKPEPVEGSRGLGPTSASPRHDARRRS